MENLELDSHHVLKNALVAAAYINFLSGVSEDQRKSSLNQWLTTLVLKENFSIKSFLTSEQELMQWRSEGLASDDLSVENAIAIIHVNETLSKLIVLGNELRL